MHGSNVVYWFLKKSAPLFKRFNMKVSDAITILEQWAPPALQEGYDNAQLICGNPNDEIKKALITLDCTESVIEEAIESGANLIIAHHPILFGSIKSLTGKNYVERTLMLAIRNQVSIYAIHTNLDNINTGVNSIIGERLGLSNLKVLAPKNGQLVKLQVHVPLAAAEKVRQALFRAGAGNIGNYDHCSFNSEGKGTFRGSDNTNPFVGKPNEDHTEDEIQIQVILEKHRMKNAVLSMLDAHPYEEVAYDLIPLLNDAQNIGSGMIGEFDAAMKSEAFLAHVAQVFGCSAFKHTEILKDEVKKVAYCGGSGRFLLEKAKQAGADVFISSDFKYHEFFDHENKITILDIGHFETEQFTPELIARYLADKNVTFAVLLSRVNTNPVHYFIR